MEKKNSGLWRYRFNGEDYTLGTFDSVEATLNAGQNEAMAVTLLTHG
jgi:hypothetical protein